MDFNNNQWLLDKRERHHDGDGGASSDGWPAGIGGAVGNFRACEGSSCAGWGGNDLTEDAFFTRMMRWDGSEEDRAGTRVGQRDGEPLPSCDEESAGTIEPNGSDAGPRGCHSPPYA
jgi:hypothetical protein